jgi:ABC-type Zn2+ transport system substrate-binding protein/surface adhesin
MLKKAGIVVLGAAAGMGVLAPAAFAGEAPHEGHSKSWDHDKDHGHHHGHGHDRDKDRDRDRDRGCGDVADARGSSGLVNAPNALSNADISRLNILASDESVNF